MNYIRPFQSLDRQNCIALELAMPTASSAIATLTNASLEEFSAAMEQLPTEKRRELAVKLILAASFAEKVELMRLLPLEEMGELAQAIAQVWQEE